MLYFAYGANLCRTHMALWCPESRPIAGAVLPDHRLVFRFWADVVPSGGDEVHGALYEVTERDLHPSTSTRTAPPCTSAST